MNDTQVEPTTEQLEALGRVTLEMYNWDRKHWAQVFPVAMVAVIQSIQGSE